MIPVLENLVDECHLQSGKFQRFGYKSADH